MPGHPYRTPTRVLPFTARCLCLPARAAIAGFTARTHGLLPLPGLIAAFGFCCRACAPLPRPTVWLRHPLPRAVDSHARVGLPLRLVTRVSAGLDYCCALVAARARCRVCCGLPHCARCWVPLQRLRVPLRGFAVHYLPWVPLRCGFGHAGLVPSHALVLGGCCRYTTLVNFTPLNLYTCPLVQLRYTPGYALRALPHTLYVVVAVTVAVPCTLVLHFVTLFRLPDWLPGLLDFAQLRAHGWFALRLDTLPPLRIALVYLCADCWFALVPTRRLPDYLWLRVVRIRYRLLRPFYPFGFGLRCAPRTPARAPLGYAVAPVALATVARVPRITLVPWIATPHCVAHVVCLYVAV